MEVTPAARAADEAAHLRFSKGCFNRAWELMVKADRTAAEDEEMIRLNQASLWHWTQRADCTDRELSIGYWQASRIHALLAHGDEAARYASLCLAHSGSLAPFYRAYAFEATARAALALHDGDAANRHLVEARRLAAGVRAGDGLVALLRDLDELNAMADRRHAPAQPR